MAAGRRSPRPEHYTRINLTIRGASCIIRTLRLFRVPVSRLARVNRGQHYVCGGTTDAIHRFIRDRVAGMCPLARSHCGVTMRTVGPYNDCTKAQRALHTLNGQLELQKKYTPRPPGCQCYVRRSDRVTLVRSYGYTVIIWYNLLRICDKMLWHGICEGGSTGRSRKSIPPTGLPSTVLCRIFLHSAPPNGPGYYSFYNGLFYEA